MLNSYVKKLNEVIRDDMYYFIQTKGCNAEGHKELKIISNGKVIISEPLPNKASEKVAYAVSQSKMHYLVNDDDDTIRELAKPTNITIKSLSMSNIYNYVIYTTENGMICVQPHIYVDAKIGNKPLIHEDVPEGWELLEPVEPQSYRELSNYADDLKDTTTAYLAPLPFYIPKRSRYNTNGLDPKKKYCIRTQKSPVLPMLNAYYRDLYKNLERWINKHSI